MRGHMAVASTVQEDADEGNLTSSSLNVSAVLQAVLRVDLAVLSIHASGDNCKT